LHSVDRTGELDQRAIADDLEDTALVPRDQRLKHLLAAHPERGQRAGLIGSHQPAVTDHVGRKNGSKATLNAFFGHGDAVDFRRPRQPRF
jgi:hypothetical protein